MRDLVLETSLLQASRAGGGLRSEEWDFRLGVEEVRSAGWGQGMVLVREREGGGRGWLLMGRGMGGEDVERECVVGVRRPVWEVEVLGERWTVAVEWKILG